MTSTSLALFVAAMFGVGLALLQLGAVWRRRPLPRLVPLDAPPISILKPLCGLDDDLEANLELFATCLDYPSYEVILGVRSTRDAAWPLAKAMAERHPGRVRAVLQRGEPGLNPKVNQLVTLAGAARYDLLVVSDSNVQVGPGYLAEIARLLANPDVGLVTNPTVGVGEASFGALLDNLHMTAAIGAGMIAAKRIARRDFVVGKSMALRRRDLEALGGFEAVKDVLAEDYVLGRLIPEKLGRRVAVGREPVFNLTRRRSVRAFLERFRRWSVMQHRAVGTPTYLAQVLLTPLPLALAGLLLRPSAVTARAFASLAMIKIACDLAVTERLRRQELPATALVAAPVRELVIAAAWLHGLFVRHVVWRGNRREVLPGTRLALPAPMPEPMPEAVRGEAG